MTDDPLLADIPPNTQTHEQIMNRWFEIAIKYDMVTATEWRSRQIAKPTETKTGRGIVGAAPKVTKWDWLGDNVGQRWMYWSNVEEARNNEPE